MKNVIYIYIRGRGSHYSKNRSFFEKLCCIAEAEEEAAAVIVAPRVAAKKIVIFRFFSRHTTWTWPEIVNEVHDTVSR